MKKLDENTKVTLTLKQLKKLVKEADGDLYSRFSQISKAIHGKVRDMDAMQSRLQMTGQLTPEEISEMDSLMDSLQNSLDEMRVLLGQSVTESESPSVPTGLLLKGGMTVGEVIEVLEEDFQGILDKVDAWRTDGSLEHWQYSQLFDLADDGLAKLDLLKPEAVKEDAPEAAGSDEEFKKAVAELLYVSDEVLGWASNSTAEIVDDQYCKKFMSIWYKVAKFVKPHPPEGN